MWASRVWLLEGNPQPTCSYTYRLVPPGSIRLCYCRRACEVYQLYYAAKKASLKVIKMKETLLHKITFNMVRNVKGWCSMNSSCVYTSELDCRIVFSLQFLIWLFCMHPTAQFSIESALLVSQTSLSAFSFHSIRHRDKARESGELAQSYPFWLPALSAGC